MVTPLAYYNEIDPYAAQWLRNLVAAGHIAPGVIDERSIIDVEPRDLDGFVQCHFFAGIGGWSLALRLAGWDDDRPVWTGSCPCQPFSDAGRRAGFADERHLWPAWFRLIAERRPGRLYGEQVAGRAALRWWAAVQSDLENARYACAAADLCSPCVGAPHIRQRLYWLADDDGRGRPGLGLGGVLHGERPPQWDDPDGRGAPGRLGDADERRGRRDAGTIPCPQSEARRRVRGLADGAQPPGATGLLGDAGHEGLAQCVGFPGVPGGPCRSDAGQAAVGAGVHAGELGDAGLHDGSRRTGEAHGNGPIESHRSSAPVFWDACDWIACRDGKRRPVEPGTFPLAHGVPARVGRLRAYGNAIVPPLAAAFVRASMIAAP